MASDDWFSGLLGSSSSDLYGDLLTDKQRKALLFKEIGGGLDEISRRAAEAGKPSLMPGGKGWLGSALSGYGAGANAAGEGMLKTLGEIQKVKGLKQQRDWQNKVTPMLMAAYEKQMNVPPGTFGGPKEGMGLLGAPGYTGPTNEELGAPTLRPAGVTPPPPGMPAAPLTPTAPPGTAPTAAGPARVPTPTAPPAGGMPGDLGPAAGEYGAWSAPTGPRLAPASPGPPLKTTDYMPQTDPSSQFAGLLSGPPPEGGLDQVVGPDGQPLTGQGVLPGMLASYGGAPGGTPPFQLASATPTSGTTPGAGGPRSQAIEHFTKKGWTPEQAAGIAANLETESSWRHDVRGDGGKAFGFGQWHPDRQENFRRVYGKDIRQSTPQEQLDFVDWELNNTEKAAGDRLRGTTSARDAAGVVSRYYERPRDVESNMAMRGSLAEKINGGGQDIVIPSGRGIPASALRNVADTGPAPGAGPAPGTGAPASGGVIPGLNMTPEALGTLNALSKLVGLGDPFGSLLETYYKSPGYLSDAETARSTAQKKVDLQYGPDIKKAETLAELEAQIKLKPQLEAAIAWAKIDPSLEETQRKAVIERESKRLEILRNAMTSSREVIVTPPGGTARKLTLTNEQILRLNQGKGLPELDLPPMSGIQLGEPVLSPGETTGQQEAAKLPYTSKKIELTWPDGEVRELEVTGQQAKDIAEGKPVPAIGWPGTVGGGGAAAAPGDAAAAGTAGTGARVGKTVYPPGYAEATTVMLKERRPKAEAAAQSLQFNETAKQLLDAGIISGTGAGLRLDVAKAKAYLGWDDARIANTEVFLATQARQVASVLASGAFGTGASITNEDRNQVASMVGANHNLDEKSLRTLVNVNEAAANWEINRYRKDVERHDPKGLIQVLRIDDPAPFASPVNKSVSDKGPAVAAREKAADAIAKGADRLIVIQRLKAAGISTEGL